VFHKENPLAYVLLAEVKTDYKDTYEEQLKFIQTITNIVIVAVENRKLLSSQIEQQVMKKELEFAAKMQSMLFPEELPGNHKIEMAAIYLPHHDIGGDYYDYIQLSEDEIAFCVGDISGKGVAAALLMANFQATLRMLIRNYGNVETFIEDINDNVSRITRGDKFITLFLGIYNSKSRILTYVNAGHNPSLLYQGGKITELETGCTLLGMFENLPSIKAGEVKIKKNAVLINYTDGLTDFENEQGEFYGLGRLLAFVKKNNALSMEEFNQKMVEVVKEYKGEKGIFLDDITLLSCRFL
jgi:phosphoserine phosphatase RsbU/P